MAMAGLLNKLIVRWSDLESENRKPGTPKCSRTEEDHFREPRGHQQSRTVWPKGMS